MNLRSPRADPACLAMWRNSNYSAAPSAKPPPQQPAVIGSVIGRRARRKAEMIGPTDPGLLALIRIGSHIRSPAWTNRYSHHSSDIRSSSSPTRWKVAVRIERLAHGVIRLTYRLLSAPRHVAVAVADPLPTAIPLFLPRSARKPWRPRRMGASHGRGCTVRSECRPRGSRRPLTTSPHCATDAPQTMTA